MNQVSVDAKEPHVSVSSRLGGYECVALLGKGSFGQVVQARRIGSSSGGDVAIKIMKQDPIVVHHAKKEYAIVTMLAKVQGGSEWFPRPLETFVHEGHYCFVMELLGPTLLEVLTEVHRKVSSSSTGAVRSPWPPASQSIIKEGIILA